MVEISFGLKNIFWLLVEKGAVMVCFFYDTHIRFTGGCRPPFRNLVFLKNHLIVIHRIIVLGGVKMSKIRILEKKQVTLFFYFYFLELLFFELTLTT